MSPLPIHYDVRLVLVSVAISMIAASAAFSFADRLVSARGLRYAAWLTGGATALGLGIWSMHYLGMLALRLPVDVSYHVPTVLLSLAISIVASATVLALVSHQTLGSSTAAVGALIMGAAIGGMHYLGMHAMRSSAMHAYEPARVTLSLAVAIALSWVSLQLAFALRGGLALRDLQRLGGAIIMGLGIAAMHYTAMSAVTFVPGLSQLHAVHTVIVSDLGRVALILTTTFVLAASLVTASIDRRLYGRLQEAHQALRVAQDSLRQSEQRLKSANHRLTEQATRDGLTGLHNRRFFDDALARELRRAQRFRQPLSLLILDVDHFKALNDLYGHLSGDNCLRSLSAALTNSLTRSTDLVCRFGGEEFAILLPGTDRAGAALVAENLRISVLDLALPNQHSPVRPIVTVSVGFASLPHPTPVGLAVAPSDQGDDLLAAADYALYQAKLRGRNQVAEAIRAGLPIAVNS